MNTFYFRYCKRWFDLVLGILLLVGLSWFILLLMIVYLITMQFPVFFRQQRIGKNNKPFILIKFRTLSTQVKKNLQARRFWLGDLLRYLSLDELPQVWNVIKGEMSLVGPRALPVEYLPLMKEQQKLRHRVRPGITGLAQVSGRHGISWKEKFTLDEQYICTLSFRLDVGILFKTFLLLLNPKEDCSLEEKKFEGNSS